MNNFTTADFFVEPGKVACSYTLECVHLGLCVPATPFVSIAHLLSVWGKPEYANPVGPDKFANCFQRIINAFIYLVR